MLTEKVHLYAVNFTESESEGEKILKLCILLTNKLFTSLSCNQLGLADSRVKTEVKPGDPTMKTGLLCLELLVNK